LYISKSKYLSGLQCNKLLWTNYNAKNRIPATDPATQAIFNQGQLVGEYAKRLHPDGIEIGEGLVKEFTEIFALTREAFSTRKPLFEPALSFGNAFARADILNPAGDDEWDMIEVKSSTEVKPVNIEDLTLQKYTFEGAGVRIRNCYLMHINNQYVRFGGVDPAGLFTMEDVTADVEQIIPLVANRIAEMSNLIKEKIEPEVPIGLHCLEPYECGLKDHCWAHLPEHSIFTLNGWKTKAFPIYEQGITEITRIPETVSLNSKQRIQQEAIITGQPHLNVEGLSSFLDTLEYPLYYLDFETIAPAIPQYDQTRPYKKIPFQYSLHIVDSPGAAPVHHMFLAEGQTDPRPEFMSTLKSLLGNAGSIVVYNQSFEKGVLKACAEFIPEYMEWYEGIIDRIVDLMKPFQSFDYYHPHQHGSASIKAVLPVLTGMTYDMEIADGTTASNEYARVTFGEVQDEDRKRVRKQLEDYCTLDTLAMVEIIKILREDYGRK
jgi:Domain of unknown function(DUF2779)